MYGGSEVDELCVQSMDWGDKGAHPGERGLNPHEKKKKKRCQRWESDSELLDRLDGIVVMLTCSLNPNTQAYTLYSREVILLALCYSKAHCY